MGPPMLLAGRVALVTGAARGIGRVTALVLAEEGADVAVREGVLRLSEALDPPGTLVNNAGIVANVAPVERMTAAAWHREVGANLSGAFHMIQTPIGDMVAFR